MPYSKSLQICKKCGQTDKLFRQKWHSKNQKYYLQTTCKECESLKYAEYQKQNLEYFRKVNRDAYLKKVGQLSRQSPLTVNPEITKEKKRISSRNWAERNPEKIKQIRENQRLNGNSAAKTAKRRATKKNAYVLWDRELTDFVTKEGLLLCKLREQTTNIKWHLDHIIPLQNDIICGLHVWNNLQLLPAIVNIRKSNKLEGGL